ncbi:uncharacterized protein N7479_006576 [Penicillium vulpinum]|uniref:DUF6594 domain-containing protein n=1 Tax=Penicillium vulpinum TaxID=29845 RepID=A0A1V6S1T1_9EURO|nr:uncharacterized protein N7479_006576 [Penicillium vulpinum]KAJ5959426.1 hypothetical protein N7479_006576 [Penicillium vulpinum]OQE07995.1 hypothetical protein PENVUL_c011G02366 [Penicillium vulpinum]
MSPLIMEEDDLVEHINRSLNEEEEFHFLRFEFLQRLNIVKLQLDLVRLKGRFQREKRASIQDLEALESTLQKYATAIRNYQFLKGKAALGKAETQRRRLLLQRYFQSRVKDQFHSHYCSFHDAEPRADPLRRALMRYMPSFLAFSSEEKMSRAREYSEGKAPQEVSVFVDRLTRFLVAITGGIFLVVPMIIMTLHQSTTKSLITVSVCIVLFALVMAFGVRVSNAETLISTATYAAVLMVFLGVNN